jgi:hypothetical protein
VIVLAGFKPSIPRHPSDFRAWARAAPGVGAGSLGIDDLMTIKEQATGGRDDSSLRRVTSA